MVAFALPLPVLYRSRTNFIGLQKIRWHGSDVLQWLPANDLQADSLVDLATKNNQLSIYIVESNRSNLNLVGVRSLARGHSPLCQRWEDEWQARETGRARV